MPTIRAWAAQTAKAPLAPFEITRREPGDHDVEIEILYCGVCHSDVHQARDEWGGSIFPMVPGHEMVGRVSRVGARVAKLRAGELAGVGCLVDSCRTCDSCRADLEQFCERGAAMTYNGTEMDRKTPTYGGYSSRIVVDEHFALRMPPGLPIAAAAPLLCAGITTWSPLRHWKTKQGDRVGVLGLGGLGHMAVKLAASLGAEVTVLSTSAAKEADARRLGAHDFAVVTDRAAMKPLRARFDLVIDTASARHDLDAVLRTVRVGGVTVLLGVPPEPVQLHAGSLVDRRRSVAGSLIGGIAETQELLDHCAEHGIVSDVEVIPMEAINRAYDRMVRGDVRYRFVIDLATL